MRKLFNQLVRDNAMADEATRMARRFFRTGGDMGKGLNYVILGLIGLFYVWILVLIARQGANFSVGILIVELFVITLVVPLCVYGAISGERERATWDALVLTCLTPAQIIAGKAAWRMGLALLVLAIFAIPLVLTQSVDHRWDAPSGGAVLFGEVLVLAWSVLLCAYGMWVSAHTKNSVTSVAVLVGTLLAYLAFLPMLLAIFNIHFVDAMNPFTALAALDVHSTRNQGVRGLETSILALPLLYLALSALFLWRTNARLRELEEPRRAKG